MVSLEKISVLGNAGSYDLCTGTSCVNTKMNKSLLSSVYPAVTGNGKCINLFKTLMTNACVHDCNYCVNRHSNCHSRFRYTPEELLTTFLNMKRLGYVDGLFLSSGVGGNPDVIMNEMINAVELLREKHKFLGYVHLKILPDSSKYLVKRACRLAERVSINLEGTREFLPELSKDKDFKSLISRLSWLKEEKRKGFLPAGITTQFVIGGSNESDKQVLSLVKELYDSYNLNRVYYSTFSPVHNTPMESRHKENPVRGYRLYQSDFLIKEYGFSINDLFFNNEFIDLSIDPKLNFALRHKLLLDVNLAGFNELLKVPGIGPQACNRIIEYRKNYRINSIDELQRLGVIIKRAGSFIKINGARQSRISDFIAS